MKLDNGNEISFFKVLSSESAKYIQVPTPFAEKYLQKGNKKKIQTIVLKTKSRVEWNVEFLKIEDGYYFTDGWFKFKEDNHLQTFDFLVFFLRSRSPKLTFKVISYATNGCQKSLLSRRRCSGIKKTKAKRLHSTPSTSRKREGSYNAGSRDGKKRSNEESEAGDENVDSSMILTKVVKKSYLKFMQLSKHFVKTAGIDGCQHLKLENDEGKKWDVDLRKWGKEEIPHILGGWTKFLEDNKVEAGSSCEISHVKDNVLHVHVKDNDHQVKKGRPFSKKPRIEPLEYIEV